MKFLRWLKSKYPGEKIGLIWDRAAAHISSELLDCAKELGIIVELLYAGMTAIMQPCDIWLNKAIKTIIKRLYSAHKNSLKLEPGQKVEVPREQIISGLSKQCTKCMPIKGELEKMLKFLINAALTHMTPKRLSLVPTSNHYQKTPYTTYSLIQHQKETNFAELYV